jgi:hypothetical protein
MTGKKRRKMFFHPDWAHAGAAAAVGDTKSLVKIHMADVSPIACWPGHTDLRVEVRSVEIYLSAVGVNDPGNLRNSRFEYPVRGRIGDHDRGEAA